tara:strand:- start:175 stop:777 length:603 start_codon:yes stop_codon:yes gene_type:complete
VTELLRSFSTPIYLSEIKGSTFDNVQEEISSCIDKLDFNMNDDWGKTHFMSDINFTEHMFGKHSLTHLMDAIDRHLKRYMKEIGYEPMQEYHYDSSWVALFEKGNYGHIHDHGAVDISGVYYHKTNGKDGNIFFESPNTNLASSLPFSHLSNSMTCEPKEGRILLFPGWLKHGIKMNETDDTRISLSFNIYFNNERHGKN